MDRENKRIRKGDKVLVIAGNEKGKVGVILKRTENKAVVQGINIRKKHVKATQQNPKGSIIDIEMPIHLSNLKVCLGPDRPLKLKTRFNKDNEKELYYLEDKKEVLYRPVKQPKT